MSKKTKRYEPKRFTEILPVPLTADEIAAYADLAARTAADVDRREANRKTTNKIEQEAIEGLELEVRINLRKVREKREDRDVECEEIRNFAAGLLEVIRLDTGEVVRSRPLTLEERQEQLFAIGQED